MFERLIEYKEMREAITRVRKLIKHYEDKAYEANPMGYGELLNEKNSISYIRVANDLYKALENK